MDVTTLIGVIGATLILIGFVGNEWGKLKAESLGYDFLNLIGSSILIWYALQLSTWPFVVLNSVWALVSLRDVLMNRGRI